MEQINSLESRHGELSETLNQNKEKSNTFYTTQNRVTNELKQKQDQLVEDLRELRTSQN